MLYPSHTSTSHPPREDKPHCSGHHRARGDMDGNIPEGLQRWRWTTFYRVRRVVQWYVKSLVPRAVLMFTTGPPQAPATFCKQTRHTIEANCSRSSHQDHAHLQRSPHRTVVRISESSSPIRYGSTPT